MNLYNTNYHVEYYDNHQYRQCLREVFNMDLTLAREIIKQLEITNDETLDDETLDEMLFDDDTADKCMETIFKKTHNNTEFQELYLLAAAKMISMNLSIGMSICFSYDYFHLFHKYLVIFLVENRIDNKKHDEMRKLLQ